jgi:3-hydroxyisobutyrate dehydrogenase-like beta-hydroxyacid dehydrogenase
MPFKVGFIGLGNMGKPMAKNLVKKGFDVTVYHYRREEPVRELVELGAKRAGTIKELAAATDVVFSMVRDDAQTEEVILGKEGVLNGIKSGSTIIITSTVSPDLCQRISKEASKMGVGVLDSPVSGAEARAIAGTLTLMIGGDESLVKKMNPVLMAISANQFHLGAIGMGQIAKIANNMILFSSIATTTEALAFGVKAGIPLKTLVATFNVSSGSTYVSQHWEAIAAEKKNKSPSASFTVFSKDLKLALKYAKEMDVELPLISQFGQIDLWRSPE